MSLPASTPRGPVRAPRPEQPVRVVPSTRPGAAPSSAPRAPFVAVVLFLLVAGLGLLLLLNTLLAQGSFVVHDLDRQITALSDREQALQQKVATLAAPQRLARQASNLGMVATVNPAFLRMPDGRVLGDPVVAPGTPPPTTSVTDPKEVREPATATPDDNAAEDAAGGHAGGDKPNQGPADGDGAGGQKAGDQKQGGGAGHANDNQ